MSISFSSLRWEIAGEKFSQMDFLQSPNTHPRTHTASYPVLPSPSFFWSHLFRPVTFRKVLPLDMHLLLAMPVSLSSPSQPKLLKKITSTHCFHVLTFHSLLKDFCSTTFLKALQGLIASIPNGRFTDLIRLVLLAFYIVDSHFKHLFSRVPCSVSWSSFHPWSPFFLSSQQSPGILSITLCPDHLLFYYFSYLFIWPCPQHEEVPRPGIEPVPQNPQSYSSNVRSLTCWTTRNSNLFSFKLISLCFIHFQSSVIFFMLKTLKFMSPF